MFETFWDEVKPKLMAAIDDGLGRHFPVAARSDGDKRNSKTRTANCWRASGRFLGAQSLPVFGVFDLHANA